VVVLIVLGVAAAAVPKWLARWWVPTRAKFHLCLAGLGVGAVVLEAWALFAGIAEARFGVLGTALPVVAFAVSRYSSPPSCSRPRHGRPESLPGR